MRIAYVAFHLENKYMAGGVGRKIREQVRLWKENGHEVTLFLHTPDDIVLSEGPTFRFGTNCRLPLIRTLLKELSRRKQLGRLIKAVRAAEPDVIYLRYGLFCHPLQRIFGIAPVAVEINTDDLLEYRHRGLFFYWLNRLTRGRILRRAVGYLPISHEIAALPHLCKFGKPMLVVPNGYDLATVEPLPAPANRVPHLAFVGMPPFTWNGVDKLVALAAALPEIQVDIIGYATKDLPGLTLPSNLTLHGFVSHQRVREILAGVDVVIGSMAMHRKPLEENSLLKIREALAYGLPVILPYLETDLSDKHFDFVLQLPNTENNLLENKELIRDFVFGMLGKRAVRSLIAPLIDQHIKETNRLAFFLKLLK